LWQDSGKRARNYGKPAARLVYLGGSFVTRKEHLGDFDACWDVRNVDDERLAPGNQAEKEQGKVIKNEKQYRITKAQVRRFQDAIAELASQDRPSNIGVRLWEAQREAAPEPRWTNCESRWKPTSGSTGAGAKAWSSRLSGLTQSPDPRAHSGGMTQEGLAHRLGVKPQQVRRYEATEYESASFARILKVVQALGLRMPRAVRLVRNG
jgi:hypothetical protein